MYGQEEQEGCVIIFPLFGEYFCSNNSKTHGTLNTRRSSVQLSFLFRFVIGCFWFHHSSYLKEYSPLGIPSEYQQMRSAFPSRLTHSDFLWCSLPPTCHTNSLFIMSSTQCPHSISTVLRSGFSAGSQPHFQAILP